MTGGPDSFLVAGVISARLSTGATISFNFNEIVDRHNDLARFQRSDHRLDHRAESLVDLAESITSGQGYLTPYVDLLPTSARFVLGLLAVAPRR